MLPFNIAILANPNAGNHHGIQFAQSLKKLCIIYC
jgi:hypothetical protein